MPSALLPCVADAGAATVSPQQADVSPAQAGGTHAKGVTAATADNGIKADQAGGLREPTSRKLFQNGQPRRKRRSHAGVPPEPWQNISRFCNWNELGLNSVRLASAATVFLAISAAALM